MRRFVILILCLLMLSIQVSAADSVSNMSSTSSVSQNGSCRVILTLTVTLDQVPSELYFPLPRQAIDITLNNGSARTHISGDYRNVDLTRDIRAAGTHTMVLQYTLPDIIDTVLDEDENLQLMLSLPLLSGFSMPIEQLEFSVTLPDNIAVTPTFSSTYHPQTADSFLNVYRNGPTVSGFITQPLKDHESLTMMLPVSDVMFPQPISKQWAMGTEDMAMIVLTLLAALYWLLTLRTSSPQRLRRTTAPTGLTAGEVGCCITGSGIDFTLMVISWAQMGYLLIHVDDNRRVTLHKRMEMGNERGEFENRCFRRLFGSRRTIDGTGFRYAEVCRKASLQNPNARSYFLPRTGNPVILRLILVVVGLFGGISMAFSFSSDTAWRTILSIVLAIPAVMGSWVIQSAGQSLLLRRDAPLWLGIGCGMLWILLGIFAGEAGVAILVVLLQLLGGIAAASGGLRTELGRQTRDELLALRRHMKELSRGQLLQILRSNPEYYHSLAPFALALGVDRIFARHFGSIHLPECTYLTTGMDGHMTAREWSRLLRTTVNILNEQQNSRFWEKSMGK